MSLGNLVEEYTKAKADEAELLKGLRKTRRDLQEIEFSITAELLRTNNGDFLRVDWPRLLRTQKQ